MRNAGDGREVIVIDEQWHRAPVFGEGEKRPFRRGQQRRLGIGATIVGRARIQVVRACIGCQLCQACLAEGPAHGAKGCFVDRLRRALIQCFGVSVGGVERIARAAQRHQAAEGTKRYEAEGRMQTGASAWRRRIKHRGSVPDPRTVAHRKRYLPAPLPVTPARSRARLDECLENATTMGPRLGKNRLYVPLVMEGRTVDGAHRGSFQPRMRPLDAACRLPSS